MKPVSELVQTSDDNRFGLVFPYKLIKLLSIQHCFMLMFAFIKLSFIFILNKSPKSFVRTRLFFFVFRSIFCIYLLSGQKFDKTKGKQMFRIQNLMKFFSSYAMRSFDRGRKYREKNNRRHITTLILIQNKECVFIQTYISLNSPKKYANFVLFINSLFLPERRFLMSDRFTREKISHVGQVYQREDFSCRTGLPERRFLMSDRFTREKISHVGQDQNHSMISLSMVYPVGQGLNRLDSIVLHSSCTMGVYKEYVYQVTMVSGSVLEHRVQDSDQSTFLNLNIP